MLSERGTKSRKGTCVKAVKSQEPGSLHILSRMAKGLGMLPQKRVDWDTEAERQRRASEELGEISEQTFGLVALMILLFLFVSTLLISRNFRIQYCPADNMLHFLLETSCREALLDLNFFF